MDLIILNDGLYQLLPVTKEILEGIELFDEINEELDDVFTDPTLDIRELPTTFAAVNRDDTVPAAVADLPIPQGLDTPVNTSLLNQTVGGNLLGNDILRQIELLKLQGQR